jgi:hypothetical protein
MQEQRPGITRIAVHQTLPVLPGDEFRVIGAAAPYRPSVPAMLSQSIVDAPRGLNQWCLPNK